MVAMIMTAEQQQKEAQKQFMLRAIDEWAFEPSEWEAETVAEVLTLPVVTVTRVEAPLWTIGNIQPKYCHHNTHWFVQNDPNRQAKVAVGWVIDSSGNYALHSVLTVGSDYVCMTKVANDPRPAFQFIPDAEIVTTFDGSNYHHHRHGQKIGTGIRRDPEKTLAELNRIRDRLNAGVDPKMAARPD